jgi:5-methylcytosine-specific restriction enzyme subunit McrC
LLKKQSHITVFEHERIHIDRGTSRINPSQLKALQQFYGENGVPYFELIHNGIKFNEYVGVLMVGKTTIEILPKADKDLEIKEWRKVLIGMLHAVGVFDIHTPSSASLDLRANSILELYFELFVLELEYLLHGGLIKKYRKTSGNLNSLKGNINFPKHINSNLIHKEHFFVNYTTYDSEHVFHKILFKTLKLLQRINTNIKLQSRITSLLLDFPEMPDIKVSENTFNRIIYDRKSSKYKNSIEIARLLLLNYHPDVKVGSNDVLALMFDMNYLWERFVYSSLRKHKEDGCTITAQNSKNFWKPNVGYNSKMKPDIVINKDKDNCIVLDTKWKNLKKNNPSPDDLRQMYVYMKYYNAKRVALVYPNSESSIISGFFYEESNSKLRENDCSLILIGVIEDIKQWQIKINEQINSWEKYEIII